MPPNQPFWSVQRNIAAHKFSNFTEPEKLCAKSGKYTITGQSTPPHTAGHLRSNADPTHVLAGSSKSVWLGASSESRLEPGALAPFETRRARPRIMTGCSEVIHLQVGDVLTYLRAQSVRRDPQTSPLPCHPARPAVSDP